MMLPSIENAWNVYESARHLTVMDSGIPVIKYSTARSGFLFFCVTTSFSYLSFISFQCRLNRAFLDFIRFPDMFGSDGFERKWRTVVVSSKDTGSRIWIEDLDWGFGLRFGIVSFPAACVDPNAARRAFITSSRWNPMSINCWTSSFPRSQAETQTLDFFLTSGAFDVVVASARCAVCMSR